MNRLRVLPLLCCLIAAPVVSQEGLHAKWEHLGALPSEPGGEGGSGLRLHLENRGRKPLPERGWSIFVSSGPVLHAASGSPFTIENLGGDFHRLRPTATFKGLPPGKVEVLTFSTRSTMGNISAAPSGAYLVEDRRPARCFPLTGEVVQPFAPSGSREKRAAEREAADRFDRNAAVTDFPLQDLPPVFPTPAFLLRGIGEVRFSAMPRITAPPGLASEARLLASYLQPCFKGPTSRKGMGIQLEVGDVDGMPGDEAYLLAIDPQDGIRIRGRSAAGVFYGIQTLRGLLPPGPDPAGLSLKALTVKDAPRFGYRGLHLDVARNFQPKASVFRVLDLMARYKLNAFHFHLTEDEGWRLEIRGLPELTSVGGRRGHTLTGDQCLPPAYGSGPQTDRPFGSGFFTRQDYQEILRYAQRLHIEVIPELEMPGHARAAIKAMEARYRTLLKQGDRTAAERFRLVEAEDTSTYTSAQNFHDNVMNPALPATYAFISKVVAEVVALHREAGVPLKHLHMGGDEVPTGVWQRSPRVQALLKERGWPSVDALWPMFYQRVEELLRPHGIPISGWEEIALRKIQSSGQTVQEPNPAFAARGWRTYVWNNVPGWGNEDLAYQLANAGYQVVLCPVTNLYFDLAATPEPEERGLRWGGFVDVDKPFDFIPLDYYRSTRQDHLGRPLDLKVFDGKARLTAEGRTHILGLQGCLWSETLTEDGTLDHMLVPKLLGLAERAWAPDPPWATEMNAVEARRLHQDDWSRFLNILGKRELPRLAQEHPSVRFRIPAPGLKVADGRVRANIQFPGMTLRYTLDGTEPSEGSLVLSGDLPALGTVKVAAFDAVGRKGPTVTAESHRAEPTSTLKPAAR
jgi:hexosaminidase